MREICLSQGTVALVDDADFDVISAVKWSLMRTKKTSYAFRQVRLSSGKKRSILMHRVLMAEPEGMLVDHRNRDGLDNRRENLRVCTHSLNGANSKREARQYKGVIWSEVGRKWVAQIGLNGTYRNLGRYEQAEDAARAYDAAARETFGEFALTNFNDSQPTPPSTKRIKQSRFIGVSRSGARWQAGVVVDGRRVHVGCFATEEEAARAFDAAVFAQRGAEAQLNFPVATAGGLNLRGDEDGAGGDMVRA